MTAKVDQIKLALDNPIYKGSVQKLYAVPEHDDLIVSETSVGGSVFDVGTIFSISGSDIARAGFRHTVFTHLMSPDSWKEVRAYMDELVGAETIDSDELLKSTLAELMESGLKTHHAGMVDRSTGKVFHTGLPEEMSNLTLVRRYTVYKPELTRAMRWHYYDYSPYHDMDGFVIPLELIVRYGATSGSSILRKYSGMTEKGKAAYLVELGLQDDLKPWQVFGSPIIDFTTKYEPEDRNITRQEAALMAGIDGELFAKSNAQTILASYMVHWLFNKMGLYLWDLKWEVATENGELIFVDTIDTDSVRATLAVERGGHHYYVHFNKQAMRDYYRIAEGEWLEAVNAAKKEAASTGEPFTDILAAGQESGKYPRNPDIDPAFTALQERKFALIQRFIREGAQGDDYRAEAETIANDEVDYFLSQDAADLYKKLNAID